MNIVTSDDLENFRQRLLADIQKLQESKRVTTPGRWLRSEDVINLLKISVGTLQNLRLNGTLPFVKIGNVIFYDSEDIEKLMSKKKSEGNDV